MKKDLSVIKSLTGFRLNKWFLDFTGENGEAMIFYSAKLTHNGLQASYTSWLNYNPASGVKLKTRFTGVQTPQKSDSLITWHDRKFGVSGTWESLAPMIHSRLYDSPEGFLDWECHQPASEVHLNIGGIVLKGLGYAEQLILTVSPWNIPMDELRWGRYVTDRNHLVWIELREKNTKQWLWMNGERIENCIIADDQLTLPDKNLVLRLDRAVSLESEKKIFSVATKIVRYIPGFNRFIPLHFLMADESKWLSAAEIREDGRIISGGMAIHERVDFKSSKV